MALVNRSKFSIVKIYFYSSFAGSIRFFKFHYLIIE